MSEQPTFQNIGGQSVGREPDQALRHAEHHAFRALCRAAESVAETPLDSWALVPRRKRVALIKDAWAQTVRQLDASL